MLVRPLVYTAITRAKERVLIVGERRALCIAIKRTDTEQRGTMLSARIKELISNVKGDHYNGKLGSVSTKNLKNEMEKQIGAGHAPWSS